MQRRGKSKIAQSQYISHPLILIPNSITFLLFLSAYLYQQEAKSEMEDDSANFAETRTIVLENDNYSGNFVYKQAGIAFFVHILHQIFGPFVLPILRLTVGKEMLGNMQLAWRWIYILELLSWVYLTLLFPFLYFKGNRAAEFSLEASYTLFAMLLRMLIVSVKYGSMTQKQWKRIISDTLSSEHRKTLRIEFWKELKTDTALEEIRYAFTRLPVDIQSLQLVFKSNLQDLMKLEGVETITIDESLVVSTGKSIKTRVAALTAGEFLVGRLCEPETQLWYRLAKLCGYLYAILPFLVRLQTFGLESFTLSPDELFFSLIGVFFCGFIVSNFYMFLAIGVADMHRKLRLVKECIIMSSWCTRQAMLPKLDFSFPETAIGLYYLRRSFFDFGRRYMQRVHLYAALMLPVSVLIVLYIVLQAINLLSTGYNLPLLPGFYLALCSDLFLCGMILKAVDINKTFLIQRDLLLEAISRLHQSGTCHEHSAKRLNWAERKLAQDCSLRPLSILGVAISQGFVNKLAALLLSGVFALVQLNS